MTDLPQTQVNPVQRPWKIAHSEFSRGWGGQEHRVLAELLGFRERGCDVHLIAPADSAVYARARTAGISTRALPTGKLMLPASTFSLADWIGRQHIDVLNTHSSRDGWFVAMAGRLAGVPVILRTRHIDVDYHQPAISRHAFTTLADHVLTTSEKIALRLAHRLAVSADRITALPTGIELDHYQQSGHLHPALARLRKSGRRMVGMVSVIRSWKGHEVFIAAANELIADRDDLDFVIVGQGPFMPAIDMWVAESSRPERFHVLGHVDDVPGVLRALDALAIPSLSHEGVPQIGLQALACQTPVIGSEVGGIPEIIKAGETGRLFPSGDASALAGAIRATLDEESVTLQLAANGRELVEQEHSRSHMIDVLDGLYHRLIAD